MLTLSAIATWTLVLTTDATHPETWSWNKGYSGTSISLLVGQLHALSSPSNASASSSCVMPVPAIVVDWFARGTLLAPFFVRS